MEEDPAILSKRSSNISVLVNAVRVAKDPMLSMMTPMFSLSHSRNLLCDFFPPLEAIVAITAELLLVVVIVDERMFDAALLDLAGCEARSGLRLRFSSLIRLLMFLRVGGGWIG